MKINPANHSVYSWFYVSMQCTFYLVIDDLIEIYLYRKWYGYSSLNVKVVDLVRAAILTACTPVFSLCLPEMLILHLLTSRCQIVHQWYLHIYAVYQISLSLGWNPLHTLLRKLTCIWFYFHLFQKHIYSNMRFYFKYFTIVIFKLRLSQSQTVFLTET